MVLFFGVNVLIAQVNEHMESNATKSSRRARRDFHAVRRMAVL